jgi:hypothetical protein
LNCERRTRAGSIVRIYLGSKKEEKKILLPTHPLWRRHKQDRRYKKPFNDLSNAFLQRRRRRRRARALAQLDRVVSRCRQRDRGRKDVGYLVDAHSTRQRHFTAFVYILYSGRHTLRCLKCGGNRGNSVQRYLIFISSNGRRQLMDIDLHDQTILIFSFL